MTVIPVNDRYRIELDSHSWRICQPKTNKGLKRWEPVAWLVSLAQAVEWLTERHLAETDLEGARAVENALTTHSLALKAAIDRCPVEDLALREKERIGVVA